MKNKGLGRGLDAIFESEGAKFGDSAGKKECSQVAKLSRSMFFSVMGAPSNVTLP